MLDFACTAGLRAGNANHAIENPNVVFDNYDEFKYDYKDTGQHCERQGLEFTSMVIETHSGAWSPNAREVIDRVAKSLCGGT